MRKIRSNSLLLWSIFKLASPLFSFVLVTVRGHYNGVECGIHFVLLDVSLQSGFGSQPPYGTPAQHGQVRMSHLSIIHLLSLFLPKDDLYRKPEKKKENVFANSCECSSSLLVRSFRNIEGTPSSHHFEYWFLYEHQVSDPSFFILKYISSLWNHQVFFRNNLICRLFIFLAKKSMISFTVGFGLSYQYFPCLPVVMAATPMVLEGINPPTRFSIHVCSTCWPWLLRSYMYLMSTSIQAQCAKCKLQFCRFWFTTVDIVKLCIEFCNIYI